MNRISVKCAQCGADVIDAEWSEHLSDHRVRNDDPAAPANISRIRFTCPRVSLQTHHRLSAMDDSQAETDQAVLSFDVPDHALERAAGIEQQATTWAYCTHPWYSCPWSQ